MHVYKEEREVVKALGDARIRQDKKETICWCEERDLNPHVRKNTNT